MSRSLDRSSIPLLKRGNLIIENPPLATEWYSGIPQLSDWIPMSTLQPGLVISDSGHMGITDYDGEGINAGREVVHKAYNFFEYPSSYRRYNKP